MDRWVAGQMSKSLWDCRMNCDSAGRGHPRREVGDDVLNLIICSGAARRPDGGTWPERGPQSPGIIWVTPQP